MGNGSRRPRRARDRDSTGNSGRNPSRLPRVAERGAAPLRDRPRLQRLAPSVPGRHGTIVIRTSERNPPPLFGAGLIDAIPDEAIEAAAKRKFPGSSEVRGRVSRLKDGRIGRFGWKAQTATLKEFVLSAAAGEMGLEVPGRHQAADPRLPGIVATGLDMDDGGMRRPDRVCAQPPRPGRHQAGRQPGVGAAQVRRGDLQGDRLRRLSFAEAGRSRAGSTATCSCTTWARDSRTPPPTRCSWATRRGPGAPGPRTDPAPARQRSRSGGRRPCGAFATPALICTTAGPRPSIRPSRCMPARVRPRRGATRSFRPLASGTSPRSSVHSPLPRRSADDQQGTRQRFRGPHPWREATATGPASVPRCSAGLDERLLRGAPHRRSGRRHGGTAILRRVGRGSAPMTRPSSR